MIKSNMYIRLNNATIRLEPSGFPMYDSYMLIPSITFRSPIYVSMEELDSLSPEQMSIMIKASVCSRIDILMKELKNDEKKV